MIRCNMFSRLSQTFRMVPSLTSYSSPNAFLFGAFGLLNFATISHHWASVWKRVASGFIYFPLQFIKLEGLENNMSKVRTYQLSAHQRLWFKVYMKAGDYCTSKYSSWPGITFSHSPWGSTFGVQGDSKQSRSSERSASRDSTFARKHSPTLLHQVQSILETIVTIGPPWQQIEDENLKKRSLRIAGNWTVTQACSLMFTLQSSFSIWVAWERSTWTWQASYNAQTSSNYWRLRA